MTISKIAVTRKVCSAIFMEITGVLTAVPDLLMEKKKNLETKNGCIKRVVDDTGTEQPKTKNDERTNR